MNTTNPQTPMPGFLAVLLCGASLLHAGEPPRDPATPNMKPGESMRIVVTSVMVNDQAKALKFYTEVLGFSPSIDPSP